MLTVVNGFYEVNRWNVDEFAEELGNRVYESSVFICARKENEVKFKKAHKIFSEFVQSK
jgi:hypothetical protein